MESCTNAKERQVLEDFLMMRIREHPEFEIVDDVVRQSSDAEFHCLAIAWFYKDAGREP